MLSSPSYGRVSFFLWWHFSPILCIKGKPSSNNIELGWLLLFLFNLQSEGPLGGLAVQQPSDFGRGIAQPMIGVVSPAMGVLLMPKHVHQHHPSLLQSQLPDPML